MKDQEVEKHGLCLSRKLGESVSVWIETKDGPVELIVTVVGKMGNKVRLLFSGQNKHFNILRKEVRDSIQRGKCGAI